MGKPKIRFKGYEDDWEQRKLKDYLEVSRENEQNCNLMEKRMYCLFLVSMESVNQIEFTR